MSQLVAVIKSTVFVICVWLCLIPSLLILEVFRNIVTNYLLVLETLLLKQTETSVSSAHYQRTPNLFLHPEDGGRKIVRNFGCFYQTTLTSTVAALRTTSQAFK